MKTCISTNCPYIEICKEYNFLTDRGQGCKVRQYITEQAKTEIQIQNRDNKERYEGLYE